MKKKFFCLLLASYSYSALLSQELVYTLLGHAGSVNSVAFSKDNKNLLSASQDASVRIWDVSNNFSYKQSLSVSNDSHTSLCFSPSGDKFSVATYQQIFLVNYPSFKQYKKKKKAHTTFVKCANYSKSGDKIISSCWRDNTLILWNADLKRERIFVESDWTDNAIFMKDDQYIASANHANTIKIWDVKSGNLFRTLAGHTDWVYGLCITPDQKHLITAGLDKTIKIWDTSTWKIVKSVEAHADGITALVLSADGKFLVSCSMDKTVKIWKTEDLTEIAKLEGHEHSVLCAAFSGNQQYLATGSSDKTVKVWEIKELIK